MSWLFAYLLISVLAFAYCYFDEFFAYFKRSDRLILCIVLGLLWGPAILAFVGFWLFGLYDLVCEKVKNFRNKS